MLRRLFLSALLITPAAAAERGAPAQALLGFRVQVMPKGQGPAYLSLHARKTYDEKAAAAHQACIVPLTWDDALVAKCKTVAYLKRMTGSYSASFLDAPSAPSPR